MGERLERGWRVVATGISFATFGIGGLVLWFFVLPVLRLAIRDRRRCAIHARALIGSSFRFFIALMKAMGVLTWEAHGIERLQRPGLLVLANHPTLLDVVFMVALTPNANCVVKAAVARNPFMRGPVSAAGFIANDSGTGLVEACIATLADGASLVMFPEGTRTARDQPLGPLQRGAANIAVRGGRAITPVTIRCEPPTLKKGDKWYSVPLRRMHYTIAVTDDIDVGPYLIAGEEALAARRLTDRLRDFFVRELSTWNHSSVKSRN